MTKIWDSKITDTSFEIKYLDCRRSYLPSYHRSINIKKNSYHTAPKQHLNCHQPCEEQGIETPHWWSMMFCTASFNTEQLCFVHIFNVIFLLVVLYFTPCFSVKYSAFSNGYEAWLLLSFATPVLAVSVSTSRRGTQKLYLRNVNRNRNSCGEEAGMILKNPATICQFFDVIESSNKLSSLRNLCWQFFNWNSQ